MDGAGYQMLRSKPDIGGFNMRSMLIVSIFCAAFGAAIVKAAESDVRNAEFVGDKYKEAFVDRLNVSTGVVVGLSLGSEGIGAKDAIIVDKGGAPDASRFCMRITSTDGLFWAENVFRSDSEAARWRVAPVTKNHSNELSAYKLEELIAAAGLFDDPEADCDRTPRALAPVVAGDGDILIAYINSSGRHAEAELRSNGANGQLLVAGQCVQSKKKSAAVFDRVCRFDLSQVKRRGVADLKLYFDAPPFGVEEWSEPVALPAENE